MPTPPLPQPASPWTMPATRSTSTSAPLTGATGRTLTLTGTLAYGSSSDQTINITGNNNYTLALGTITATATSHNPYRCVNINAVPGIERGDRLVHRRELRHLSEPGRRRQGDGHRQPRQHLQRQHHPVRQRRHDRHAAGPLGQEQRRRRLPLFRAERHAGGGQQRRADQQHHRHGIEPEPVHPRRGHQHRRQRFQCARRLPHRHEQRLQLRPLSGRCQLTPTAASRWAPT